MPKTGLPNSRHIGMVSGMIRSVRGNTIPTCLWVLLFVIFALEGALFTFDGAIARQSECRSLDGVSVDDCAAACAALSRISSANLLFRQGRYTRARRAFGQIITQLPEAKNAATAASLLQLASSRDYLALLSSLHNNVGLCNLRARRYQLAQESFEQALAIDRRAISARSNLGLALLHQKRFRRAIREFEGIRGQKRNDAKLHLDLGKSYVGDGEFAKARWALAQAMRLASRQGDIQSWGNLLEAEMALADAYLGDQNLQQAEFHLRQVLDRASGQVQARYQLCQILVRQGRTTEANEHRILFQGHSRLLASIQGLLGKDPGNVEAMLWIADAYRRMGLLHLADIHYRQLIARDPQNRIAQMAIQRLAQRMSPPDSAFHASVYE